MNDSLTILQSRGPRLTKLVVAGVNGQGPVVQGPEPARVYDGIEIPISGLDDIYKVLGKLVSAPTRFIVRGKLVQGSPAKGILRRTTVDPKTGERPGLTPASHWWVALDMDDVPLPPHVSVNDLKACGQIALTYLPAEFSGVRCIIAATGGHGFKAGARLRIFFCLSRAVSDSELRAWLADAPVDKSIFSGAQPIFTAAPVLSHGVEGYAGPRLVIIDGDGEVQVPASFYLPETTTAASAEATASMEDIQAVAAALPNQDISWEDWNQRIMALWASSGGSMDGLEVAQEWSAKSPKHDAYACEARWQHLFTSPPTSIGFGSLVHWVRAIDPTWHQPSRPRTEAVDDFEPEERPVDTRTVDDLMAERQTLASLMSYESRQARDNRVTCLTADFDIASDFEDNYRTEACYVPEKGEWSAWCKEHGWSPYDGTPVVNVSIREHLEWYLNRHREEITKDQYPRLKSTSKVRAVKTLLESTMVKKLADMDKASGFIQTPEGAFNLATGEALKLKEQWDLFDTRHTSVTPRRGPTPLFDDLTLHLCDDNLDVLHWLQQYIGYCLLGDPKAQIFLIMGGQGGNGKGTMLSVLQKILGAYAVGLNQDVLLDQGRRLHPASLFQIYKKRLAVVQEPKGSWNESLLKTLTGGDSLEAREMNKSPVSFVNTAGIIIAANKLPTLQDGGPSMMRRLRYIGTTWTPKKADPSMEQRILDQEGPAILWNVIQWAKEVSARGGVPPEQPAAMAQNANAYFAENDNLFAWLSAECLHGPDYAKAEVGVEEALKRFNDYTLRSRGDEEGDPLNCLDAMSKKAFIKRMESFGVKSDDGTGRPLMRDRQHILRGFRFKIAAVEELAAAD